MNRWHIIEKCLTSSELNAISKLIAELRNSYPDAKFKLFGSKLTGSADEESDLDLLILLPCMVTGKIRKQIVNKVFDINLRFETNISPLIMGKEEWENSAISVLPIHYFTL
jgi:predicted nucleotidyltransferase